MGERVSPEAVARDREASRLRAAARRRNRTQEEHERHLEERRLYEAKNADHINEQLRKRYEEFNAARIDRPFIGWDGEGYSNYVGYVDKPPERKHHYMLFGCSAFPDDPLVGVDLHTEACLDYLLFVERKYPDAFHVGFAFDYDVNMILCDLESRHLRHLADYGVVHWHGYRIAYIPGKMFRVSKGRAEDRVTITVDDTFGFFHSKYTTSLLKFNVANKEELAHIMEGKDKRSDFTYLDAEYVKRYWQDEISYFPPLMNRVREACYDAGLNVYRWYGPGVLASYILRKHSVTKLMSQDAPKEVKIATQYAFAAGRFQTWRCGLYHHRIYTADINSAYIYACSLLPRLDNGRWIRSNPVDRGNIAPFGLYHIAYDDGPEKTNDNHKRGAFEEIYPLFHRDKRGLYWPARTEGWYWSPEAKLVANDPSARFLEAWIYDGDGTSPFEWVHSEFDKRLDLQHQGNAAEKTLKWALAAIYGAFARRVGWDRKKRQPPKSHQLEWAGFITSWCRAEMYRVAYECWRRGGLISIDTDGVTSTVPFDPAWLERGEGEKLGQWKLVDYAGILSWQSGFYWLLDDDGKWSTVKTRGMKRGSVEIDQALTAYEKMAPNGIARFTKVQTKFVGFKEALKRRNGMAAWRQWTERPMDSVMGKGSTNLHVAMWCIKCRKPDIDMMHVVTHLWPDTVMSEPHPLPWLEEQMKLPENMLIVRDSDEMDKL